jgi:X-X-X-Leu-X-X-Gly heptad repeat protein
MIYAVMSVTVTVQVERLHTQGRVNSGTERVNSGTERVNSGTERVNSGAGSGEFRRRVG